MKRFVRIVPLIAILILTACSPAAPTLPAPTPPATVNSPLPQNLKTSVPQATQPAPQTVLISTIFGRFTADNLPDATTVRMSWSRFPAGWTITTVGDEVTVIQNSTGIKVKVICDPDSTSVLQADCDTEPKRIHYTGDIPVTHKLHYASGDLVYVSYLPNGEFFVEVNP